MTRLFVPALGLLLVLVLSACGSAPAEAPAAPQATAPAVAEAASPPPGAAPLSATSASTPLASVPEATPTASEPYMQTVGSFFAIHEIGLGPEGWVSLTNFTSVPASTKGLYLCQGADCFALPEAAVEPGATARIAVGDGEGLERVIATNAAIGELKPSDGEVAVFASDQFDDPRALLIYLQWGSTPHALTDLAVEAGLWIKTGYAPTSEKATRLYRVEESGWWLFEE